jgi:hypothetical protein
MMLTWNTIQANGGGWTASTGKRYCKIGAALIFETDEKNPQEA